MNKISKYNDFILEKQFNSIIDDIFRMVEDVEGKWTSPTTIEWDYSNEQPEEDKNDVDELTDKIIDFGEKALNKLRDFLQKLPKEKIKEYYVKMVNKFKSLPETLRRKLIAGVTGVFLTFVSLTYLLTPSAGSTHHIFKGGLSSDQTEEIIQVTKDKKETTSKASFEKAQGLVKLAEAAITAFLPSIQGEIKTGKFPLISLHIFPRLLKASIAPFVFLLISVLKYQPLKALRCPYFFQTSSMT